MEVNVSKTNENPDSTSISEDDKELDEITEFIESRPLVIERWLQERASVSMIERIKQLVIRNSEHRSSITSDMFQQWLNVSPCKVHNDFLTS